ncbi:MAG TPA: sulfite exporter TauE/SafE family protein [Acidimicrobiales bacterium]|nr:sulfite exporter TauE/SafE family protein [Acidimicrobiales bacterium]
MNGLDPLWLVLAGFGGGLSGSVAGLASLVSYPALLAVGLPPVAANVSNTVALVFSTTGSVWGSRPELTGQRARARRLAASAVGGGIVGAVLLLATPSRSFALVVPWLIGLASLGVLIRRNPTRPVPASSHPPGWALSAGVFLIAVYGGYFGAAAGVLMLSVLLLSTGETLARSNAMKNVLLGGANAVAAVAFIAFGPVRWTVVLPLAAGFLVGGRLGPAVVRRAPSRPLRALIACAGLGLAVHLGLDAYA